MGDIVDLSHVIEHEMITYPGLPGPRISDHLSREASRAVYAPGTEFQIGRLEMVANTGTYLDTPAHRYPHGFDLAELPLDRVADVPGVCVSSAGPALGADLLDGVDLRGRAVLFSTGWDRHWRTEAVRRTRASVPHRGGRRRTRRRWRVRCRHRLGQHRRHPRQRTADPQHPARRWDLDRRASHRVGSAGRPSVPLLRHATEGPRHGHVPRQGVGDPRRVTPVSVIIDAIRSWNQATPASWRGLSGPGR